MTDNRLIEITYDEATHIRFPELYMMNLAGRLMIYDELDFLDPAFRFFRCPAMEGIVHPINAGTNALNPNRYVLTGEFMQNWNIVARNRESGEIVSNLFMQPCETYFVRWEDLVSATPRYPVIAARMRNGGRTLILCKPAVDTEDGYRVERGAGFHGEMQVGASLFAAQYVDATVTETSTSARRWNLSVLDDLVFTIGNRTYKVLNQSTLVDPGTVFVRVRDLLDLNPQILDFSDQNQQCVGVRLILPGERARVVRPRWEKLRDGFTYDAVFLTVVSSWMAPCVAIEVKDENMWFINALRVPFYELAERFISGTLVMRQTYSTPASGGFVFVMCEGAVAHVQRTASIPSTIDTAEEESLPSTRSGSVASVERSDAREGDVTYPGARILEHNFDVEGSLESYVGMIFPWISYRLRDGFFEDAPRRHPVFAIKIRDGSGEYKTTLVREQRGPEIELNYARESIRRYISEFDGSGFCYARQVLAGNLIDVTGSGTGGQIESLQNALSEMYCVARSGGFGSLFQFSNEFADVRININTFEEIPGIVPISDGALMAKRSDRDMREVFALFRPRPGFTYDAFVINNGVIVAHKIQVMAIRASDAVDIESGVKFVNHPSYFGEKLIVQGMPRDWQAGEDEIIFIGLCNLLPLSTHDTFLPRGIVNFEDRLRVPGNIVRTRDVRIFTLGSNEEISPFDVMDDVNYSVIANEYWNSSPRHDLRIVNDTNIGIYQIARPRLGEENAPSLVYYQPSNPFVANASNDYANAIQTTDANVAAFVLVSEATNVQNNDQVLNELVVMLDLGEGQPQRYSYAGLQNPFVHPEPVAGQIFVSVMAILGNRTEYSTVPRDGLLHRMVPVVDEPRFEKPMMYEGQVERARIIDGPNEIFFFSSAVAVRPELHDKFAEGLVYVEHDLSEYDGNGLILRHMTARDVARIDSLDFIYVLCNDAALPNFAPEPVIPRMTLAAPQPANAAVPHGGVPGFDLAAAMAWMSNRSPARQIYTSGTRIDRSEHAFAAFLSDALPMEERPLSRVPHNLQTPELCAARIARFPGELVHARYYPITRQAINSLQEMRYQSTELCEAAVRYDPLLIGYVRDQTEELCLLAVSLYPRAIENIRNRTLKVKLAAVRGDPFVIKYIDNQDVRVALAAVRKNPAALEFVDRHNAAIVTDAIIADPMVLRFAKHQDENIALRAVRKNGAALEFVRENVQTPEICLAAVRENGLALAHAYHASREIFIAALRQTGLALQHVPWEMLDDELEALAIASTPFAYAYVRNQTEEGARAMVSRDPEAIEAIWNPSAELLAMAAAAGASNAYLVEAPADATTPVETDPLASRSQSGQTECSLCCDVFGVYKRSKQCLQPHIMCEECFERWYSENPYICPTCKIEFAESDIEHVHA